LHKYTSIYKDYKYWFNIQIYSPLLNIFHKLNSIYNIFDNLKENISLYNPIKNIVIKSFNLYNLIIYNMIYIKSQYEIIRKYSLYKSLKSNNINEPKLELAKINFLII